jgi:hypothetical protein
MWVRPGCSTWTSSFFMIAFNRIGRTTVISRFTVILPFVLVVPLSVIAEVMAES